VKAAPSPEVRLSVDAEIYPLEAVQAAAYAFTSRAHVRIAKAEAGKLSVVLKTKSSGDPGVMEGEFLNELLHQSLRLRVSASNQRIREYIVTRALVSAQPPTEPPCAQCEAEQKGAAAPSPAPAVDKELEAEIDKLLAAIDKEEGVDPLQVAVPWEERFGKDGKEKG
jgi:His-Xaa-Ser system protein HxsD